jgi:aspartyl-tRNA(Asn)/glutamyl-tRNA(Gln) amidotransferase subunit A
MHRFQTILAAVRALEARRDTSAALVRAALDRALDRDGEGVRVFTRLHDEAAMLAAAEADRRYGARAPRSLLDGIPISIKDLFDVAGETTMAGAWGLRDEPPAERDAVIVQRLRNAGAAIVGKTNMTEFALSGLGLNPHFGTPRTNWRRAEGRIAGGSSSGAAVSVLDGMALGAIGTDTGGSVRIPAAFCGLVGFKPTASRIDQGGMSPLSVSLDSIGFIAPTVSCCALLDRALADTAEPEPDVRDTPIRIGVPETYVWDETDPRVLTAFEAARRRLEHAGVEVVPLEMEMLHDIAQINAAGGFSPIEGWRAHGERILRHRHELDPRVANRFLAASDADPARLDDMHRLRRSLIEKADAATRFCDLVMFPTVAIVPPRQEDLADDDAYAEANRLSIRNAAIANQLDRCAISIPCRADAPVGLTLMGPSRADARLLALAARLEPAIRAEPV